uniref:SEC7 domain-containing protein n=2 Tax=Plectus sambesii TaxID=2011161 RepID=A0A914VU46_9BILA
MAVNGLYIVQGESNAVVALLRRAHRGWPQHQPHAAHGPSLLDEQDPLLRNFADLRDVLNSVSDLADMNPDTFLSPFLDVIRSELTTGPVTGQALASVGKFLSYGLIDPSSMKAANAVESIADAVTHAKFVGGTDTGNDEVVLLKILQVLRTLLLTPVGRLLSNESVCEIMQSCFRICFETRLSELLRKSAESTLADMIQLLFTRLPTFKQDLRHPYIRKLVMRAGGDTAKRRKTHLHKRKPQSTGSQLKSSLKKGAEETNESVTVESPQPPADEETKLLADQTSAIEQSTIAPLEVASQLGDITEGAPLSMQLTKADPAKPEDHVFDMSTGFGFVSEEDISQLPQEPTKPLEGADVVQPTSEGEVQGERAVGGEETDQTATKENRRLSTVADEVDDGAEPDDDSSVDGDEETAGRRENKQRVNERGVRFTVDDHAPSESTKGKPTAHIPYGLPCVRELLRFLISLTSPLDRANTEQMILMGLNLLTVALEAGADYLGSYTLLLPLLRNELCRSLLQLLDTEKLTVFAASSRVCFLLFEALRTHLKFQLESYFHKLMAIVTTEQMRISYEQKEMALESLVQMWRIPGLVTELYLNYDCDLYCSNLFEDLTKLLLKNAFPVAGLHSTHILSLDALLTVVDTIDTNCLYRASGVVPKAPSADNTLGSVGGGEPTSSSCSQLELPAVSGYAMGKEMTRRYSIADEMDKQPADAQQSQPNNTASNKFTTEMNEALALMNSVRPNRMPLSANIPSLTELIDRKKQKRLLTEGTDLFNQSPSKAIAFLQEHGFLATPLVPEEVVHWLRENPRLDKKKIAEYICSRKNVGILKAFVSSFPMENTRLDDALRMFLETFRLPGEAAEISMVMTQFADHWYKMNDEPFNHADAAFTLSYGIIMLNTDQHNPQVKRNQPPMTIDCFKRNLSGTNDGKDFDQEMLEEIYNAIKHDEIVMPAEQTGLVKENYLWKVLLRRGEGAEGEFTHAPSGLNDHDLFHIIWGPTTAALAFVFDKSEQDSILQKALSGYRKCAAIAAHYGMSDVFDNLIISLCKFSTLMTSSDGGSNGQNLEQQHRPGSPNPFSFVETIAISFGENQKAQMAAKAVFQLVHAHGDILKEGWKNILDCVLQLFKARMLPKTLTDVEDFVDPKGWVSIVRQPAAKISNSRSETGLLSWFGLGGSGGDSRDSRGPTADEQELIKTANAVIADCRPEQLVTDSKYLTSSALVELFNALVQSSSAVVQSSSVGVNSAVEDALVFYMELMISIALENKDRLPLFWSVVNRHIQWLLTSFVRSPFVIERAVVGLLRLTNRNLFRLKEEISDEVLHSLSLLQTLRPQMVLHLSKQIAYGLHELLRSNAANVHKREHWAILFSLLEAAGAAAFPDHVDWTPEEQQQSGQRQHHSDTEQRPAGRATSPRDDRGYTSETDVTKKMLPGDRADSAVSVTGSSEWIHVDHADAGTHHHRGSTAHGAAMTKVFDRGTIMLRPNLGRHEPVAFLKCCETIAFLVRDAAHITPENFASCVRCLRTFVEASLDGGRYAAGPLGGDANSLAVDDQQKGGNSKRTSRGERRVGLHNTTRRHEEMSLPSSRGQSPAPPGSADQSDLGDQAPEPTLSDSYHQ